MREPNASWNRGWIVTGAALAINLVLGVLYAWGVMAKALVGQWGWSTASAMLPFTVSTGAFAVTMIFAGRAQDKVGPRWVAMIGGMILGIALIASSFAQRPSPPAQGPLIASQSASAPSTQAAVNTLWQSPMVLVVAFGLMGGIGIGLGYSATTPPAIKWFPPSHKGLITGLVVSGVGLAAVYISPLTQWLLGPNGDQIPNTFLKLGIGTIAVTAILAQFLRNPPAGHVVTRSNVTGAKPASARDLDWPAMLSTRQFYQLWMMFSLAASPGLMVIANIAIIAKEQAAYKWGFVPIILLAIFNSVGRVVSGIVSDRVGRTNTMVLAFLFQAVNLFIFVHYNTPVLIIFGAAFTGLCYGTIFTLFPAATADFYGLKNLGVNYGIVFTGFGVAGVLGPIVAGIVHDHYRNYTLSYLISASLLIVSAVLAFVTHPPRVPVETPEPEKVAV